MIEDIIRVMMNLRNRYPDPFLKRVENSTLTEAMLAVLRVYIIQPDADLTMASRLIKEIKEL